MADWTEQLLPASWRGVGFMVDSIDHSAGDHTVLREYPFADLPSVYRMSEAAEEIKFSAYVIGDDYIDQRDALRAVLTGDGELIHPTIGVIRAHVLGKFAIKESPVNEGGMARFDLTFVRVDTLAALRQTANTQSILTRSCDLGLASLHIDFNRRFDLSQAAGWVREHISKRVSGLFDSVWAVLSPVHAIHDTTGEITRSWYLAKSEIETLKQTPARLASAVTGLFTLPPLVDSGGARSYLAAASGLFTAPPDSALATAVSPYATPQQAQLRAAGAVVNSLVEVAATILACRAMAVIEWDNYDQSVDGRRAMSTQFKRLLSTPTATNATAATSGENTENTEKPLYEAMRALWSATLSDLATRSKALARLSIYTPGAVESIWSLSHRLYDTTAYADEIMTMNPHITQPLRVPAGIPLRIVLHD